LLLPLWLKRELNVDKTQEQLDQEYLESLLNGGDPALSNATQNLIRNEPPAQLAPPEVMEGAVPGYTIAQKVDPTFNGTLAAPTAPASTEPQQPVLAPAQAIPAQPVEPPMSDRRMAEKAVIGIPGMEEQFAGLAKGAQAQADLGKAEQRAYANAYAMQNTAMKAWEADHKTLRGQIDSLIKDEQKGFINPNQYLENKSTGSKIATAIGLLIGGLGGGKGGNPMSEYLDKQIERDIQAQLANRNHKMNLIGAMEKQLGSLDAAQSMFMAMRQQMLGNQIQAAGAAAKGPIAKAAAEAEAGRLFTSSIQNVYKTQQQLALLRGEKGGGEDEPEILVPYTIEGEAAQQKAYENLGTIKNLRRAETHALELFDKAAAENTYLGRALHAGFQPAALSALRLEMLTPLKDNTGKVSDTEIHAVDNVINTLGDKESSTEERRQALVNFFRSKQDQFTVQVRGASKGRIDPDKFPSTAPNMHAATKIPPKYIEWAKANPNDPRAAQILKAIQTK